MPRLERQNVLDYVFMTVCISNSRLQLSPTRPAVSLTPRKEMGKLIGDQPSVVITLAGLTWLHQLSVCSFRCGKTVWGPSWLSSIFTRQKSWKGDRPHPHPCLAKILHKGSVHAFSSGPSCECWECFSQRFG